MTPDPVSTDDYIAGLWASVTEGLITYNELRSLQARYLSNHAPIPIEPAALSRRQIEVNLVKARRRLEREPDSKTARALLDYWTRQTERAE
jgi:hypothetical protein